MFILQIVLGALAFVSFKNDDGEFSDKIKEAVQKIFDEYKFDSGNKDKQKAVDDIQQAVSVESVDDIQTVLYHIHIF